MVDAQQHQALASATRGDNDWSQYAHVLNRDALDMDKLLAELRETGIGAVEGIINEEFRQRLCEEADAHFEQTSTAEVEVIGPFNVRQQFNAKAQFDKDSNFMLLRRALHKLFLDKVGDRAKATFVDEDLDFNYFELMQYPAGSCGISPHRDHAENINIVCVFAIGGRGFVYGCDDREGTNPRKYNTVPGAMVIMRAPGFEAFKAEDRPFHYVTDIDVQRYSFAVRQVRACSLPGYVAPTELPTPPGPPTPPP